MLEFSLRWINSPLPSSSRPTISILVVPAGFEPTSSVQKTDVLSSWTKGPYFLYLQSESNRHSFQNWFLKPARTTNFAIKVLNPCLYSFQTTAEYLEGVKTFVPKERLELSRPFGHRLLRPGCLPFHHLGLLYSPSDSNRYLYRV